MKKDGLGVHFLRNCRFDVGIQTPPWLPSFQWLWNVLRGFVGPQVPGSAAVRQAFAASGRRLTGLLSGGGKRFYWTTGFYLSIFICKADHLVADEPVEKREDVWLFIRESGWGVGADAVLPGSWVSLTQD